MEEKEEMQAKSIDNVFDKIIKEIFPNLRNRGCPSTGSFETIKQTRSNEPTQDILLVKH
jgi:hypothetical protein